MSSRDRPADWITQRWVELTGRRVDLRQDPWLEGPVGQPEGIGKTFFDELARQRGLDVVRAGDHHRDHHGDRRGLLQDFAALAGPRFDPAEVDEVVADFYQETAAFRLDAWAEWSGLFRPFGRLLALIFSRRLQQLNVPLSALETSRGMTSEIVQLVEPATGDVRLTAWVRELIETGHVLYAGSYSICEPPGFDGPCVKVVFPLPNGNAIVVMKPVAHADGSFSVVSAGERFGDPGFYFTVHGKRGRVSARYVSSMKERIHVYGGEPGVVRADHSLTLWGQTFLRLHYRMVRPGR